jgi:hypothetical protein
VVLHKKYVTQNLYYSSQDFVRADQKITVILSFVTGNIVSLTNELLSIKITSFTYENHFQKVQAQVKADARLYTI